MKHAPRLLSPDNFTPPSRTPWGGRIILDHYKRGVDLGAARDMTVCGESWEVSVEPSFPSRFSTDGAALADAIARRPDDWLGPASVSRGLRQTPLLVKLLDARDDLSVQVHPELDDPDLAAGDSGKVEAWYVLAAAAGAGLYLGFRAGVTRDEVERCLRGGGRLDALMNFVPVAPGDAFVITPGTAHAVGAGVTLLEPQLVLPGRRAVTYRFWDWDRRYDDAGERSAHGRPRPLHVDRALAVTDWDGPRGADFLALCRSRSRTLTHGAVTRTVVARTDRFALERWAGQGVLEVPAPGTLLAAVCLAGAAELRSQTGSTVIRRGYSAVVPAACGALTVIGHGSQDDGADDDGVEILVTRALP